MGKKTPNLFVVGSPKCGTTTLYDVLKAHKDVYLPRIKEPMFFNDDNNYKWGVEHYLSSYYKDVGDQAVIADFTALYAASEKAVQRIKKTFGSNVKIVILTREPCERAFSHYQHDRRDGRHGGSFENIVAPYGHKKSDSNYIAYSMYYDVIKMWENNFGKNNILILKFEDDIVGNLQAGVDKLCDFLAISRIKIGGIVISNPAQTSIAGMQGVRGLLLRDSRLKGVLKKFVPPGFRQMIRQYLDNMTLKKIDKKECLDQEVSLQIYKKYFHEQALKLRDEYGIDYTRRIV